MTPANAERQREEFMTQNVWFIAAIWMALALSASFISIWAGISVALVEILVGVVAGNFLGVHATTDWINFLALLGSGVLTFLAGAEIDPRSLKANLRASGLIGILSFGVPFVTVWVFAAVRPRLAAAAGADRWSRVA
jgi:Kef-type K+ transport system membrane component KefB